jgi:DNA invertase Pin-like site-specific DNA recombinase
MTRAAIYARVSTARQAERDLSLPDQIAQCRAYCERQGWEAVEVFCEPGASALDDDRQSEPHATRMGELLFGRRFQQGVPSA